MNWYYAVDEQQVGPLTEAEFNALVQEGKIKSDTKVWRDGLPEWVTHADLAYMPQTAGVAAAPAVPAPAPVTTAFAPAAPMTMAGYHKCVECGGTFAEAEMISFDNAWVCALCKPVYVQKLREGVAPIGTLRYAGFWIRAAAEFIDGIIIQVINLFGVMIISATMGANPQDRGVAIVRVAFTLIMSMAYFVGFNGRFGATPGKMVLKLKIVRPDGEPISYGRAFGRYFAKMLSSLIFCIGYMMAGWDEQKRALHDRIADTRVIHVS